MSLREAQSTLIELADALADWQRRLSDLKATIPDPRFEAETDRPLNAEARMLGAIESILQEDMATLEQSARSAAGSLDQPTTEEMEVMSNPTGETTTPDQDRVESLAYHISARILEDAFAEDDVAAAQLITNGLGLDPREAKELLDFMQAFIWDLKLKSGEVVDTDEETADFKVTKFGRSLDRKIGGAILPLSLWDDLDSISIALRDESTRSFAVSELVEMSSPEYLELSNSEWDRHRLADLILRNSPLLQELKEKVAVAKESPSG